MTKNLSANGGNSAPAVGSSLADMNELIRLIIRIGARRVRADFAARIADPATAPRERAQMQRMLADYPQTPDQRSRP